MNNMKEKFKNFYEISNKVTIDEVMISSKSKKEIKFYLLMKPIKFKFKLHCLCGSETNYLHNYIFVIFVSSLEKVFLDFKKIF